MKAVLETTVWKGSPNARNHTYLIAGNKLVAYISYGGNTPVFLSKPMPFDTRGRSFKPVSVDLFKAGGVVQRSNTPRSSTSRIRGRF